MIALADRTLQATFLPEAGMLGASLRHRGEDLLSPLGIPLLHPWANRLSSPHYTAAGRCAYVPEAGFVPRDEHGLPIHGLTAPEDGWRVVTASADHLHARLYHPPDGARFAAFPFAHTLDVDARLDGMTLRVRTTIAPTSGAGVPVAFGYHPYLRLPGVARRAWTVTLPAMRALELDVDGIPTGRARLAPAWAGQLDALAWDDAYDAVPDGARFSLEGGGRRITIVFEDGWGVAQLFAPRGADVVCFEPMTAPVDALVSGCGLRVVAPGAHHSATFSITVEDQ